MAVLHIGFQSVKYHLSDAVPFHFIKQYIVVKDVKFFYLFFLDQ